VTLRDLAVELGAPVLIVAEAGLGTLNHTALTLEALAAKGVSCAGLVIGSWPATRARRRSPIAMRWPGWPGACRAARRGGYGVGDRLRLVQFPGVRPGLGRRSVVAHSIEFLDEDSDAAIRRVGTALRCRLPSQLRVKSTPTDPTSPCSRPTGSFRRRRRAVGAARALPAARRRRRPGDLRWRKMTLARLIVASADLLDLHGDIYRRCLPPLRRHPSRTARPGAGPRTRPWGAASPPNRCPRAGRDRGSVGRYQRRGGGPAPVDGDARIERVPSAERRESREVPGAPGFERLSALNPARSRA
jgi:hypothetical protein